jgi:hypothetical protein
LTASIVFVSFLVELLKVSEKDRVALRVFVRVTAAGARVAGQELMLLVVADVLLRVAVVLVLEDF